MKNFLIFLDFACKNTKLSENIARNQEIMCNFASSFTKNDDGKA